MYETLSPAEIKQLKEELMGLPIELFGKIFIIAIGIVFVLLFVGLVGHSINSQKHRKKMKSRETEPQENRYIISGPPVQRMNRKEIEEQAAGILEKKYEEVLLPEIEEKLKPEAVIEELLQNGLSEELDLAVTDLLKEKYEHQLVPEMQRYIKDNTASVMKELRGELKRRDYADTHPVKYEEVPLPRIEEKLRPEAVIEELLQNGLTEELDLAVTDLLKEKYEHQLVPEMQRYIKDNTASAIEELRGELKRRDYADTLPVKSEQGYTDAELEELIAKLLKNKYEEILEPGIERFIKDNKKFEMLMNYPPYMLQGLIEGIVTDKLRGRQPKMTARGRKASKEDDDEDEGIEASETDIIIEELDEVEKKARKESPEVTMEEYERIVTSKKGIFAIDNMSGEKFENFLAIYFKGRYHKVKPTQKFGDYGADLLLQNKDGKIEAVVQAKRHLSKITVTAVYETLGGMTYYGVKKGIIVTNNEFTNNAAVLAGKGNIELWDRDFLIKQITKDDLELVKKGNEKFKDNSFLRTCPVCEEGIMWKKRNHETDEWFYGCSRFRETGCNFTDDLDRTDAKLFLQVKNKEWKCSVCGKHMVRKQHKTGWIAICSGNKSHESKSIWFPKNHKKRTKQIDINKSALTIK